MEGEHTFCCMSGRGKNFESRGNFEGGLCRDTDAGGGVFSLNLFSDPTFMGGSLSWDPMMSLFGPHSLTF